MYFLIVDPSPTMRRILKNALIDGDKNIIFEAADGIEAIESLKVRRIDCVLTEWDMPNMSGIALTKAIKRNENFKDIPVIFVTDRGSKADVIQALSTQVSGYIVKPFTKQILREKIQSVMNEISQSE
jgi:two-component system chemotaxis response regulator CheY